LGKWESGRNITEKKFELYKNNEMKEFILDGNNFNDLLRGGFGVHGYEEPITIKWINYEKSKKNLGNETILTLLEIFLDCDNSGHSCKVEIFY